MGCHFRIGRRMWILNSRTQPWARLDVFRQQSGDEIGRWVASETLHSLKGKYSDSPRECKSYLAILYVVLRAFRGEQNAFTEESRVLHSRRVWVKCCLALIFMSDILCYQITCPPEAPKNLIGNVCMIMQALKRVNGSGGRHPVATGHLRFFV